MFMGTRHGMLWLLATCYVACEALAQYAGPQSAPSYGQGAVVDYQIPSVPPTLLPAGQDYPLPVTPGITAPAWQNPAAANYGVGMRTAVPSGQTAPVYSTASLYGPPPIVAPESSEPGSAPAAKGTDQGWGYYADGLCSDWFGGVYGLVMTRDNENDVWLSYDSAFPDYKLLASRHADMDWAGGFETRVGRYFHCRQYAWELVYWGLFPDVREANACDCGLRGNLRTWIRFDNLVYDPRTGNEPVDDFFNNVERHRLLRSFQFQNVELNFLNFVWPIEDSCWRYSTALGVRYFRFDEGFQFASDRVDEEFTGDPEEIAYTIDVVNSLVGAQIGGRVTYQPTSWFNLFADAKIGLYGNHIRHRSSIGGTNGFAVVDNPGGAFDGEVIDVRSSKNDVAFLSEVVLGGNYQLTRTISLTGGYRAVALTGVALSTNQIPLDNIWTVDSVREIDSNGSLILHGAFAGVTFNY